MDIGKIRANMRSVSVVLLIVVGCLAIFSGHALIKDPSGKSLGLSTAMLSASPFEDFRLPGIVLLIGNGILNIVCAVFAAARWRQSPAFLTVQGWVLIVWILSQVAFLQNFNLLHLGCLSAGLIWLYTGNLLRKKPSLI